MARNITEAKDKWARITGDQGNANQDDDDIFETHFTGKNKQVRQHTATEEAEDPQELMEGWECELVQSPLEDSSSS